MGLRFRKSFGKGPLRVTISNKGVSTSVGVKGARVTKKANGKVSTTVGVPGTGLSYTSTSKSKKKSNVTAPNKENNKIEEKMLKTVCKYCFIPMLIFGVLYSFIDITIGLFCIGVGLLEWRYYKKHK